MTDESDFYRLPYGKYRGWTPRQIIQHDRQYLTWFVRNCRADPRLLAAIGRLLHEKAGGNSKACQCDDQAEVKTRSRKPWDRREDDETAQNPSGMAKRTGSDASGRGGDSGRRRAFS